MPSLNIVYVTIEGLLDNITEPRLKAADGEIEMNGLQRASE